MKKVILITGTSSGVGLSLAVKLAADGHTVYASMRDINKAAPLKEAMNAKGVSYHLLPLDVESSSSVNNAIQTVIAEQGKIDCLINNAGAGFVNTLEHTSEEQIQKIMDINFMGVVRTIKAVIPHMRQANEGHIINVSSVGGLVGQPFNEIYCAAKFAVEGLTESLASYLQAFNIQFTAVEPGGIASEFINNVFKNHQAPTFDQDEQYTSLFSQYVNGAQNRANSEQNSVYQTSDEVADCIIDVINSENSPLRFRTSAWAEEFCELKTKADPTGNESVNKVYQRFLGTEEKRIGPRSTKLL